jgi:hypothetical protein
MPDNIEDKQVLSDVEREIERKPIPAEPKEPSQPEPAGDPSKAQPDNGGWGTQDVPVPAN